ncbi:ABC transporter permease [Paenibacillus thalictri]|uniref:ABC transporter permease n=1 Tax=Paenibacillus thalictri TaxID=2527873 RepID=A0A4Q9DSB7_9BACL|nr:ABC transporter permease [Paenibacillus thalictri]TBL78139.1 ABC transporter permease [Paenibacillus thalictri]
MMELTQEQFEPLSRTGDGKEAIVRPSLTFWQDAWRRLKKNKLAMFGLYVLALIALLAIFGPFLQKYDYATQDYSVRNLRPSAAHWFGTDDFGRDMWVRVWWGARISLFVGITAAVVDLIFGVLYGGISAYYGGKVDNLMQRFIEIIYSIPYLLIAILLIMVIGPGVWTIILAYAIVGWVPMARLVRGQILQLKEQEYVLAARTLGAGSARIIARHLVPNALGLIIVQLTFAVPNAIFFESFLSFLGLGIKVPLASLGSLLSDGVQAIRLHPHRVLIPTLAFSLILLSFNLLGDGLRDALDPKMRR